MTTEDDVLNQHRTSFAAFADEISNHFADLVAKASTAPKDAWEHWEGKHPWLHTAHLWYLIYLSLGLPHTPIFRNYHESAAFTAAIDWSERWIQMLLGFEVVLFIIVIVFRNSYEFQSVLFFVICLLVAFSERINTFCAEHWRLFATQNYFDAHGTFAVTLFSGPLLIVGFIQVVCAHVPILWYMM